MRKLKFEWKYGENESQKYYEVMINKDYLCVFSNKWTPDIWMGICKDKIIHNKTLNDRVRKKYGLEKDCDPSYLKKDFTLCSNDPEYMMRKVEWCYKHNIIEISQ